MRVNVLFFFFLNTHTHTSEFNLCPKKAQTTNKIKTTKNAPLQENGELKQTQGLRPRKLDCELC